MSNYSKLLDQLKCHEGFSSIPYEDTTGNMTIGYGHKITKDDGDFFNYNSIIDEFTGDKLLQDDLSKIFSQLLLQNYWVNNLDEIRRYALVNMAFNLGTAGLGKFIKTLSFVYSGNYADAAREMLNSKWANQVGNRAIELSKQMETGEWQF